MQKLDEKKKVLLWWALLVVCILVGGYLFSYFTKKLKTESEDAVKTAAEKREEELTRPLSTATQLLGYIGEIVSPEGKISEEDYKHLESAKEKLGAYAVGIFRKSDSSSYWQGGCVTGGQNEKALENAELGKTTLFRANSEYSEWKDVFVLTVPWMKNGQCMGLIFVSYELDELVEKFSEPIYEETGFSFLCNMDGNIIIPARQISKLDANGRITIVSDGKYDLEKFKKTLNEIEDINSYNKIDSDKDMLVFVRSVEKWDGYVVVSVLDRVRIFDSLPTSTKGFLAVGFVVFFLVICQSVYLAVNSRKKHNEFNDVLNYDELTGLPTKPHHKQIVSNILKKDKGTYAYAACDVSEFKYINSTFGYEYGNMALKHIANTMSNAVSKDETVSRTSGDHFAMLLRFDNVDALNERILGILNKASELPVGPDGRTGKVVFTCGVYLITEEKDVNRIRARANVARKGLKKSLLNQTAFYSEEAFNKNLEDHELEADLMNVIQNRELVVFLQPKYGISDEKVIGAEALVRWNHKKRGLLPPSSFIPLAEQNGSIREIDFYVFDKVCKQLKVWKDRGKKLVTVSVNFSRVHLHDDDFVAHLVRVVKDSGVEPKYLEIELTETAVYDEMEKLLETMYLIKEAGFGLSMDDFGSGYSSLHLLREMPVDVLKLDKGFLDDCGHENQREKKVISHVISMAKDLNITVLAEGVETESQKEFLRDANCDIIQGYYYAKPMPMEEFDQFMPEGN